MIIYIDLDDTLADYTGACNASGYAFPQSAYGFYRGLVPLKGAIEAVAKLQEDHEVYILTGASPHNLHSYSEKAHWVSKHLGFDMLDKLILSNNKGLAIGDILIDNNTHGRGTENFTGRLIKFNSWEETLKLV